MRSIKTWTVVLGLLTTAAYFGVTFGPELVERMSAAATNQAIAKADALEKAVSSFESQRLDVEKRVVEAATEGDANDPRAAARRWESRWSDIDAEIGELESALSRVGETSLQFFKQLDELAQSHSDTSLQRQEERKNKELNDRWTREFENASQALKSLRGLQVSANSIHASMLSSILRASVDDDIEDLKKIAARGKELLEELRSLTDLGKTLLGGK